MHALFDRPLPRTRAGDPGRVARSPSRFFPGNHAAGFTAFLVASGAWVAPIAATAQTQAADKSGYTLWNPTPPDELRAMATDRPNQTDSPTTVDAGHLQIEGGFVDHTRNRNSGFHSSFTSYGDVNLRLGVLNAVEVNLIVPPHVVAKEHDDVTGDRRSARGFGDITLGGKINFWGNEGFDQVWATALGLKPQVKIPTAKNSLGNGHTELGVSLPFSMNLPAGFGLSVQPSVYRLRNSDNSAFTTGYEGAVAIAHDIGPLNAYVEYVLDGTSEGGQPKSKLLNVGATAAISRNVVVDTGFGFGLNRGANDFRILVGMSVRF